MHRVAALFLVTASLWAGDFQTGQAARAVIGQASFTTHEVGVAVLTLTYANGRLYATDVRHRLLIYDVSKMPGAKEDLGNSQDLVCPLCGFGPVVTLDQAGPQRSPAISVFGNHAAIADAANHQVLLWNHTGSAPTDQTPDVILGNLPQPSSVTYDGHHLFVGDAVRRRVFVWNSLPKVNDQLPDAVLGNSDVAGPDSLRVPAALASDGTNLFVADPENRRILVFTAGDTQLPANPVINSASLAADLLAPGTLAEINGHGLSDSAESARDDNSISLPRKLGGVQVFLNGNALPLLSVSDSQVRFQIPYTLGDANAASLYVRTEHADGSVTVTNATTVKLSTATPGLFAFGGTEPRSGLLLHTAAGDPSATGTPVTADDPAKPGEQLIVWANGLGLLSEGEVPQAGTPYLGSPQREVQATVTAVVGEEATAALAYLPLSAIGIYEVRIKLPENLSTNPKTHLFIMQNGYASNTITFPVRNPVNR